MTHRIVDGYCFDCQGGCILEMAERNARYAMKKAMAPHPWDEWNVDPREESGLAPEPSTRTPGEDRHE